MKDKLEQFVTDHRDEFDSYMPPGTGWPAVDRELRRAPRQQQRRWYAAAAAVLLIAGAGLWLLRQPGARNIPVPQPAAAAGPQVTVGPEMREAAVYYASVVDAKRAEISGYGKEYPDLFRDFGSEIDTLRAMYAQLEAQYDSSGGNDAVTEALVANLQLQVQLLNRQIQIIRGLQARNGRKPNLKTM